MNVLLVPCLGLDVSLLERLARSVDYPIAHKVVINNSRADALDEWHKRWPEWTVLHYGKNLGCAGSWNMAPKVFPTEPCWLISNDDQEFQPGCLERICKNADEHAKDHDIIYVNEFDAYDMFVWTAKGVRDFGTFDENIFPIYLEDWEYRARLKAGGAKPYRMAGHMPVKHGKPHAAGKPYHDMLAACKPLNEDYLMRKWGTGGDDPVFNTPFGNPNWPIRRWELEPKARAKREQFWEIFWNRPNVSLYK